MPPKPRKMSTSERETKIKSLQEIDEMQRYEHRDEIRATNQAKKNKIIASFSTKERAQYYEDYPEAAPSYVKPKEVSPMPDKKRTRSQKKEESAPLSKEEGECN